MVAVITLSESYNDFFLILFVFVKDLPTDITILTIYLIYNHGKHER